MERKLFSKSPIEIRPIKLGNGGLRLAGSILWLSLSAGAGYIGAELNRQLNTPVEAVDSPTSPSELILPGYIGRDRFALDIWDRYVMTNDRLNKLIWGNEITDRNQDRQIKELQEHTGVYRPVATPRPRPTVSERLKPAPKFTPTVGGNP